MAQKYRIEYDALGSVQVPAEAIYGSFTARAFQLFQLSGQKPPKSFIRALGLTKEACAVANQKVGYLETKLSHAIQKAAREYAAGKFPEAFILDPFQAGAGTPLNMNANEIIANRANQMLGKKLGTYEPINPNNHVNMGQSTNDVIPTATRIAGLFQSAALESELAQIIESFDKCVKKYRRQIKVGRTHLEDAVPITVGQEFSAWRDSLKKDLNNIRDLRKHLYELGIGGNAIGSGINSHPDFQRETVKALAKMTKLPLKATKNTFETTQSMTPFCNFSAGLRSLANDLLKICNDLKLLNMGPLAGIAEITLHEVEPGSSIMPGKVNPSIPEAAEMTCMQVLGNDQVISLAAAKGQLQLNIFAPVIMFNLLWSLDLLTNTLKMLREYCIDKITVNISRCQELFDKSLSVATALNPYLGYHQTALLVNEALKKGQSITQIVREKNLIPEDKLKKILDPQKLTTPRKKILL